MLLQLEVIQDLVVGEEWSVDEETLVVSVDVIGAEPVFVIRRQSGQGIVDGLKHG